MASDTQSEPAQPKAFTGRKRRKQTRWSVRFADVVSRVLITVGGIGTIVAVLLVFVFLAYVVLPLFSNAYVENESAFDTPWTSKGPLHVAVDEYRTLGWALYPDGKLVVFRVKTGDVIETRQLREDVRITAASFEVGADDAVLGLADGSVVVGRIGFEPTFVPKTDVPEELHDLPLGDEALMEKGVVTRTPIGQFRLQQVVTEFEKPVEVADSAITLIDNTVPAPEDKKRGKWEYDAVVYTADGQLLFCDIEKKKIMGRRFRVDAETEDLPFESRGRDKPPKYLILGSGGASASLVWEDGLLRRYDTRLPKEAKVVEEINVLEGRENATVTACRLLIGRETTMIGDSQGGLRAWFLVRQDEVAPTPTVDDALADKAKLINAVQEGTPTEGIADDRPAEDEEPSKAPTKQQTFLLALGHELPEGDAAVTAIGISERSRMMSAGYANGHVNVFHVTTNQLVLEAQVADGDAVTHTILTPKDDGLIAATEKDMASWDFVPKHPEATWAALFLPVWYEGYSRPIQMWQSSFAGVSSEMKLGLYPLIFGTIKATLYSMLFGAPLALLAAIYTSEFVNPRLRSKVKPVVEVMASLPSVVLGFLAALVFAPIVEKIVPTVLASFLVVPFILLIGAYFWQLLPRQLELILNRYGFRLLAIFFAFCAGIAAALLLGPICERIFFDGQVMRWLDDTSVGNGIGGWLLLLLPLSALIVALSMGWFVNPWMRSRVAGVSRARFGLLNLAKFGIGVVFTFALALTFAGGLTAIGLDVRNPWQLGDTDFSPIGTFVQRNALVVGFVMGFAIIPIIYTIAEDALSTVPKHLRSASLGAGATAWQTATRVVIPTAMSGLFSALMIGLGRAVGETMIVLMAAGNTPVMEMNVFSGFRTLSANIAVELPEAVRDSTHYRTLFLAALTLFVMTFIVNTIAEMVRLRFRRRAYQL